MISAKCRVVTFSVLLLWLLWSLQIYAQPDTVRVPSDIPPGEGNLNIAVNTAIDKGILSNTVFMLEPNGYYVLTDSILVPAGAHLMIVAPKTGLTQETAPPQILCSSGATEFYTPLRFMFFCYGHLTLRNLWLLYANTNGWQVGVSIIFKDDTQHVLEHKCNFDGVIIDYSTLTKLGGGSITVMCRHFNGMFKNCYWKNCTSNYSRYYGRAVSFPFADNTTSNWHVDSLLFENCTFANIGIVYSQQKKKYSDYVKFNHCTFLNTVLETLQSGWWYKLAVTNSIFVNAYMYGHIPAWSEGEQNGGTVRIDSISTFGFGVRFTELDRRVLFTNSSYFIETWLIDWMENNIISQERRHRGDDDLIPIPQPILNPGTITFFESDDFPYMNKAHLYDATDPDFILPPTDSSAIKTFLLYKWWGTGAAHNWPWKPENSLNHLWPLEENLAYTNDTLLTAGMGGFPLGDLYRWFPDKYEEWKVQEKSERERITHWLETGKDSIFTTVAEGTQFPTGYSLSQNFPNPFNPTTRIEYSLPKQEYVSLTVYNLLGQEIVTLFEGKKASGNYTIKFDASKLTGGIYLYMLKTNEFTDTKKLILLK